LCSSLNVRDQISYRCKTTCRIMILYILTFKFPDSSRRTEDSEPNCSKRSPNLVRR
jgi:hypothetical protein